MVLKTKPSMVVERDFHNLPMESLAPAIYRVDLLRGANRLRDFFRVTN
jgi:hypothetical protein